MKKLHYFLVFLPLAVFFNLSLSAMHTENQALLDAVCKHDIKQVRRLLRSNKVDVNYQGVDCGVSLYPDTEPFRNALPLAVCLRDTALIKLLLQADANPNVRDQANETPLHIACYSKSTTLSEIVSLLINAGADVNAQDTLKRSPLHVAAHNHNYVAAQLLLNTLYIDSTLKDNSGRTALDIVQNYPIPSDQDIENIPEYTQYADYNTWLKLQKTRKENKQKMINLFTFDTTSLKKIVINYVKTHRDKFSNKKIAKLPADLKLA